MGGTTERRRGIRAKEKKKIPSRSVKEKSRCHRLGCRSDRSPTLRRRARALLSGLLSPEEDVEVAELLSGEQSFV